MSLETCLILDFEANKKKQRINKKISGKISGKFQ
jgi:hypothetical protein